MNHVAFVHSLSDLLRDYYRSGDYAAIILPLVVIRRLNDFDFKAASLLPPVEAARQLTAYLTTCPNRDILNLMNFESHLGRLVSHGNLLPLLLEKFAQITLGDHEARLLYEEIIRRFLKAENGEQYPNQWRFIPLAVHSPRAADGANCSSPTPLPMEGFEVSFGIRGIPYGDVPDITEPDEG